MATSSKGTPNLIFGSNGRDQKSTMDFVRQNPDVTTLITKFTRPENRITTDKRGNAKIEAPSQASVIGISDAVYQKSEDCRRAMELFPDLKIAAEILISSIISPKDMVSTAINHSLPLNLKVSPISAAILEPIQDYFKKTYPIAQMLHEILYDTLFLDGCYPVMTLPESSIDDVINGHRAVTTESMSTLFDPSTGRLLGTGLLAAQDEPSGEKIATFESLTTKNLRRPQPYSEIVWKGHTDAKDIKKSYPEMNTGITMIDNLDILKLPVLQNRQRAQTIENTMLGGQLPMTTTMESMIRDASNKMPPGQRLSDAELMSLLYKNGSTSEKTLVKIKTVDEIDRYTVGEPLIMRIPPEALIPFFKRGDPSKHVYYALLIDGNGRPLSYGDTASMFDSMRNGTQTFTGNNSNTATGILNRVSQQFNTQCGWNDIDRIQDFYIDIMEADWLARLRSRGLGEDMAISRNTEAFQILLARQLKNQRTQMLLVPESLITYYAFDYRRDGTGKSLTEDSLTLLSLRATAMLSTIYRNVTNAVGLTDVSVTLPEDDPDHVRTFRTVANALMETRNATMRMPSTLAMTDIWRHMAAAGLRLNAESVAGFPDLKISYSETNANYAKPDTEVEETLRDRTLMSFYITPEMVDASRGANFATSIVTQNLLLTRRVVQMQDRFNPLLSKHVRTTIQNHGGLMEKLRRIVLENIPSLYEKYENEKKDSGEDFKPDEIMESFKDKHELFAVVLLNEALFNLDTSLIRPDTSTFETKSKAVEEYVALVTSVVDARLPDDLFNEALVGESTAERIKEFKAGIISVMVSDYIDANGILPEISDILEKKPEGTTFTKRQEIVDLLNDINVEVGKMYEKTAPVGQASDADATRISGDTEVTSGSYSGDSSSSSDSGDDDTSSDDGMGDDAFSMDLDLGSDDGSGDDGGGGFDGF